MRDRAAMSYIKESHGAILDIGCGEGITLERLVASYPHKRVVGIDALKENVEIGRAHGLPVLQADVFHLPLTSQSVDCALLLEVLEHLDEPAAALREIKRVLKAEGILVIVVPNDPAFFIARLLTLRVTEALAASGHTRRWSPGQVSFILRESGFRILSHRSLPIGVWPCALHSLTVASPPGP